jgi:hypothetical protein
MFRLPLRHCEDPFSRSGEYQFVSLERLRRGKRTGKLGLLDSDPGLLR